MFDMLWVKPTSSKGASFVKPNEILLEVDGVVKPYTLYKGGIDYLYKQLGISLSTSKDVFKVSEEIWKDLKDYIFQDMKEQNPDNARVFSIDKESVIYYADNSDNIIDMLDTMGKDDVKKFIEDSISKFDAEISSLDHTRKFYTEGKNGLIKIVIYKASADLTAEDYTPVTLLEINYKKSEYAVYTGILIYKNFTFIPSMQSVAEYKSYISFVTGLNIIGLLELSLAQAEGLYNAYLDFKDQQIEISARELLSVMHKVGYKLEFKDDNGVDDIPQLEDEENSQMIKDFFNSFKYTTGETAFDLMRLSEIKKAFRYNKLTLVDLLEILSREYLKYEGAKITAQTLSDIIFGLYTKKTDVLEVKSIKNEVRDND